MRMAIDYNQLKNDGRPKVSNLLAYISSAEMQPEDTFSDALEMFINDCGFSYEQIAGLTEDLAEDSFPSFTEWLIEMYGFYTLMHMSVVEIYLKHQAWERDLKAHCEMLSDKYGEE